MKYSDWKSFGLTVQPYWPSKLPKFNKEPLLAVYARRNPTQSRSSRPTASRGGAYTDPHKNP